MRHRSLIQPLSLMLLLMASCLCSTVQAAAMQLLPLRLDVSPKGRVGTLQITNTNPDSMNVQIEVVRWRQESGRDQYEATDDFVFAPPILAIPSKATRTIRFRFRRAADETQEQTYRVYVQQLAASPDRNTGDSALAASIDVKLRIGIPLFVSALRPTPPDVSMQGEWLPDGRLAIQIQNAGKTHIKIFNLELRSEDNASIAVLGQNETGSNYLLGGSAARWIIPASDALSAAKVSGHPFSLSLKTDDLRHHDADSPGNWIVTLPVP